jgi:hypothetical protein
MLLSLKEFSLKYGININTLHSYVMRVNDSFLVSQGSRHYIDEDKYLKDVEENIDLIEVGQDYYYYFNYAVGLNDVELIELLTEVDDSRKWKSFLAKDLFKRRDYTLPRPISGTHKLFLQWAEELILKMHPQLLKSSPGYRDRIKELNWK